MRWKILTRWLPRFFGAAIVLLGLSGLYVVFAAKTPEIKPIVTEEQTSKPADSTADTRITEARAAEAELKDRADELKNRIDELRWILALIVTAAGLFTLAQGVAAGFSAQSFVKQAEDLVGRLNELEKTLRLRFDTMTGEVKARYPVFADIEERRVQAYSNLSAMLKRYSPLNNADEGFDSRRHFYQGMPLAHRQELLSVERFISYDIAGQNEPAEEFARQLRRLAQFYWAKFLYEQGRGFGYIGDLERAEYLLDLANRRVGTQFYLLNDLGNIRLESYKARIDPRLLGRKSLSEMEPALELAHAQKAFDDSIAAWPEQLRAYYNRAVILAAYRRDFAAAAKDLEAGLQYPNWEENPIAGLTCNGYFNLACCYGRLAESAGNAVDLTRKCVEALEKAAKIGQVDPNDVKREYSIIQTPAPDETPLAEEIVSGDLYALLAAGPTETREAMVGLRVLLSANYRKI